MHPQQPFYAPQPSHPQAAHGGPGQFYPQQGMPPPQMQPPYQQPGRDGVDGFFSSVTSNLGPIGNTFSLIHGGQHYVQQVQQSMGLLSTAGLNYYFAVNTNYGKLSRILKPIMYCVNPFRSKLSIILMPYLRQWNYSRAAEQIPGGPKYRPPRTDTNCPDLYIPLMAFFTFIVLASVPSVQAGNFSPEVMYTKAYRGLVGWGCHVLLIKGIMLGIAIPSAVSFIEAICYSGYLYVLLCLNSLAATSGLPYGGMVTWVYSSLCMAVFLVKSFKALIHQETRNYGGDPSRYNYLLLVMALVQIPLVYFLGP